jgi:signal transduction histidine kinase
MGLPFKNGFELADAMGFGKMYQASKEHKENNVQMESKKKNKKLIRLTESDLHRIVRESVNKILKESIQKKKLR